MEVEGTDHGSGLSCQAVSPNAPLSSAPCTKIIYKLVKVTPDGSVHDIESEEEIRAVEAVLRDQEAHDSDEYSEPDAKKSPMDRRSLLIQLQVYDTLLSQITILQRELKRGSNGQLSAKSTLMEVADEEGEHGEPDWQVERGARKGAGGTERLIAVSLGADVGQEPRLRDGGRGWDGPQDYVEMREDVRRGSGGCRSTKRQQRPNPRSKEIHSPESESGSPVGEGEHRAKRRGNDLRSERNPMEESLDPHKEAMRQMLFAEPLRSHCEAWW